ncbi:MAG: hypothetical protein JW891_11560 [Candidatus Lokiarchaeota archaeon]|nr:hypothetical protein [Candidatus Lokiarchaeota archaeon]
MIYAWWTGLDVLTITLIIFFWIIINLVITTIFLKIALAIVNAKHTDFGEVFLTAFVVTILFSFVFIHWIIAIIMLILIFYFIGKRHDIGFCMAIIVAILALVIALLVILAVFVTIGIIMGITLGIGIIFGP